MNRSPLQLEHYELDSIQLEPVEEYSVKPGEQYPSFERADFGSHVEFGQASREGVDSDCLWGIRLRLKCTPKEGLPFPYSFDVAVTGFVSGADLPADDRQQRVLVNGTSLLYGVLRDEVLRLTARMKYGAVMLPTAQFHDLAAKSEPAAPPSAKKRAVTSAQKKLARKEAD